MGTIRTEDRDGIFIVTISEPGKLNAWTRHMREKIVEAVRHAADSDAKALVFTGDGDAFCAGQNFNEVTEWDENTPWVEEVREFYRAILDFKKPTVAAVNGVAAGSGLQFALLCDYRVAAKRARMGQTEARWGLASITGTWLLSQTVGIQRARALALSASLLASDQLLAEGLVDEVVEDAAVVDAAVAKATELASFEAETYAITKAWCNRNYTDELMKAFDDAAGLHKEAFAVGASNRGAQAFLDRS